MDPQAGGSFIPKQPLAGPTPRAGMTGLFFSIGLLLFLGSLGAAGAVFGYQQYLTSAIDSKDASLKATEDAFDPDAIDTLVRTDRRITEMQGLLQKHTAPSAIFALLGDLTLVSVQYSDFEYGGDPAGETTITLSGIADSFSSVALQSDQFGASKHLSNVVFSGITINDSGKVSFDVSATVSPAAISYAKAALAPAELPQPIPSESATSTPATTTTP